jgi:hypothetical protein
MALYDPLDEQVQQQSLTAMLRGVRWGLAACLGKPVDEAGPLPARPAICLVAGFTGAVNGQVELALSERAALGWAGSEALDDVAVAALQEGLETVTGAIANELARLGLQVHFSAPNVRLGRCDGKAIALALPGGPAAVALTLTPPTQNEAEGWLTLVVPGV